MVVKMCYGGYSWVRSLHKHFNCDKVFLAVGESVGLVNYFLYVMLYLPCAIAAVKIFNNVLMTYIHVDHAWV